MKREKIIQEIKETARQITNEMTDVFTCQAIYPKCYLATVGEVIGGYNRPGKNITPEMRPTELLAYVKGMAQVINR